MRVLLVDDDPLNRSVLKAMLDVVGAEVTEAEDGPSGLAELEIQPFDIVLMDLRMPGMDGLTAIRHIRARGDVKAGVPVIVVTADTAADLRQRCLDSGADDVIQKPVAMDALLNAMGRMMAKATGSDIMIA